MQRPGPGQLWRALCASLLADHAAGFGGLNYVHRPTTSITTYNALSSQGPGDASSNLPISPLTFNGGELEMTWGATGEVEVRQNVMKPPPSPHRPPPPSPTPPSPFETFPDGVCTGSDCGWNRVQRCKATVAQGSLPTPWGSGPPCVRGREGRGPHPPLNSPPTPTHSCPQMHRLRLLGLLRVRHSVGGAPHD